MGVLSAVRSYPGRKNSWDLLERVFSSQWRGATNSHLFWQRQLSCFIQYGGNIF